MVSNKTQQLNSCLLVRPNVKYSYWFCEIFLQAQHPAKYSAFRLSSFGTVKHYFNINVGSFVSHKQHTCTHSRMHTHRHACTHAYRHACCHCMHAHRHAHRPACCHCTHAHKHTHRHTGMRVHSALAVQYIRLTLLLNNNWSLQRRFRVSRHSLVGMLMTQSELAKCNITCLFVVPMIAVFIDVGVVTNICCLMSYDYIKTCSKQPFSRGNTGGF